jgi:DNA-directed RNA polymerase subunit RPC12/RpoP
MMNGGGSVNLPYKCAQCGQRYQTTNDLMTHATLRGHMSGM